MQKLLFLFTSLAFLFSIVSCDTESATNEDELDLDLLKVESHINTTEESDFNVSQSIALRYGLFNQLLPKDSMQFNDPCVEVTIDSSQALPIVTLDFGDGCTDEFGITRKGILTITFHSYLSENGKTSTISRTNYFVNDWKVEGDVVYFNNSEGLNLKWQRTITDGKITSPQGKVYTHSGTRTIAFKQGLTTPAIDDNIFEVESGNHTVSGENGTIVTTITEPLLLPRSCMYVTDGSVKVESTRYSGVLEFGDGTCDSKALFIHENGNTFDIDLKR